MRDCSPFASNTALSIRVSSLRYSNTSAFHMYNPPVLLLLQVYGFHAPMHQDQVRYASKALRGGEDSIMEPDLLAVSNAV